MSLGAGILFFVIGAILAFAVRVQLEWIDLSIVGYILMAGGAVGIVLGIVLPMRRRAAVAVSRTVIGPMDGEPAAPRLIARDEPPV